MDADVVRLLLVEDNEDDAVLIANQLRRGGIEVSYDRVETAGALLASLAQNTPDLVISDCKMPAFDSQEALAAAARHHGGRPLHRGVRTDRGGGCGGSGAGPAPRISC